jgi:hypothetical protein
MEKCRLSLVFSWFLLYGAIQAQSIDPASVWRVDFCIVEPGVNMRYEFYTNYINGDTTINAGPLCKIPLSGHPAGLYLVRIEYDHKVQTKKLMIK